MSPLWSNTTNRPDLWVGSCLKSPYPELVWGRRHSSHPPQNTIKQESLRTPALGVHVQVLAAGPAEAASVRRGWAQTPSDKMAPHGAPVLRKGGKHCLGSEEKTFVPLRAPEKVEESFFFPDRPKWLPSTELIPKKQGYSTCREVTSYSYHLPLPSFTAHFSHWEFGLVMLYTKRMWQKWHTGSQWRGSSARECQDNLAAAQASAPTAPFQPATCCQPVPC